MSKSNDRTGVSPADSMTARPTEESATRLTGYCISSGRRPCRPLWAKEQPNSHENFTCVAEHFLSGERMKASIWPAGTPAATIETPDGLILALMGSKVFL